MTNCEQQPNPLDQLKLEAWHWQLDCFVGRFHMLRYVDLQSPPVTVEPGGRFRGESRGEARCDQTGGGSIR